MRRLGGVLLPPTLGVPLSHIVSHAPQMEGWGAGSFLAFFMLCSVTEGGGLGLPLDAVGSGGLLQYRLPHVAGVVLRTERGGLGPS